MQLKGYIFSTLVYSTLFSILLHGVSMELLEEKTPDLITVCPLKEKRGMAERGIFPPCRASTSMHHAGSRK